MNDPVDLTDPLLMLTRLAVRAEQIEDPERELTGNELDNAFQSALDASTDEQLIICAQGRREHDLDVWLDQVGLAGVDECFAALRGIAAELRSSLDKTLRTWAAELREQVKVADATGEAAYEELCERVQLQAHEAGL
jgi:hypothetical protein